MNECLREVFAADREETLGAFLLRFVRDPLNPTTSRGRFRPSPLLLALMIVIALAVGTFIVFSFGEP